MAKQVAKQMVDSIFKKSLTDLIRGIRSHKEDEASYINGCIEEIKQELKTNDKNVKSVAVQKLTYVCLFLHFNSNKKFS